MQDGIGSAGRFVVGGRLGRELDADPRRWRMVAEGLASVGMGLEVATSIYPQNFLCEWLMCMLEYTTHCAHYSECIYPHSFLCEY